MSEEIVPMTATRRSIRLLGAGAAGLLVSLACSDSTGSDGTVRPPAELNVILLPDTAPTLCQNSVSFYAVRGVATEAALTFPTATDACPDGEDFVRLRLDDESLLELPDGTPIAMGDSVLITLTWVGSDSIMFDLEPTGLKFDPANPAELKIEYDHTGDDLDGDGDTDQDDSDIEQQIAIWRQENPGEPFVQIGTGKIEDQNEVEADLTGFSRYALAY